MSVEYWGLTYVLGILPRWLFLSTGRCLFCLRVFLLLRGLFLPACFLFFFPRALSDGEMDARLDDVRILFVCICLHLVCGRFISLVVSFTDSRFGYCYSCFRMATLVSLSNGNDGGTDSRCDENRQLCLLIFFLCVR